MPIMMDDMEPLDFDNEQAQQALGAALRRARKHKDLTQVELAAMAHMSPTIVNRVERGHQSISAIRLARIATILGVSLDDLLDVHVPVATSA